MARKRTRKRRQGRRVSPIETLGYTGRRRRLIGSAIHDEVVVELRGRQAIRTYDRMLLDPVIGGALWLANLLLGQASWAIEPGGDRPIDLEAARFVDENLMGLRIGFQSVMAETAESMAYGFSVFETLFREHEDGTLRWAGFAPRDQRTIIDWKIDEGTGEVLWAKQELRSGEQIPIPRWKMLHFRPRPVAGRPEGRSILRNSYLAWMDKQEFRRILKVGVRRDLTGLPVLEMPGKYLSAAASDEEKSIRTEAEQMVRGVERDEREGIMLPHSDEKWKLSLLSSGGRRQLELDKLWELQNKEIAIGLLSDFMLVGHERVGSFALHSDKTEIYAIAMGTILGAARDEMNNYAIPVLLALNGPRFAGAMRPRVKHGDIEELPLQELSSYVSSLAGARVITPGPELEMAMRRRARLPLETTGERPVT